MKTYYWLDAFSLPTPDRVLRLHKADMSDGKFAAVDAMGLDLVFKGWGRTSITDDEILHHAAVCFDGLYQ